MWPIIITIFCSIIFGFYIGGHAVNWFWKRNADENCAISNKGHDYKVFKIGDWNSECFAKRYLIAVKSENKEKYRGE